MINRGTSTVVVQGAKGFSVPNVPKADFSVLHWQTRLYPMQIKTQRRRQRARLQPSVKAAACGGAA